MKSMVTDSSKRTSSSYYGASGTIIGHLHWDPLVYSNKDGSKRYLFRVDTVSCRSTLFGRTLTALPAASRNPKPI